MYDKAIKDMEANTGIYDFVYIEQDIIYSYLARDFLVDITQSLKDNPKLKAPDFSFDDFTTLHRLLQGPEDRRRLRRADGGLRQGLPLPQGPVRGPGGPGGVQGEVRLRPGAGHDLRRNTATSPSSSPPGARTTTSSCGARRCRRLRAIRRRSTSSSRSIAPSLRRLQLGHQPGRLARASVEQRRHDEQPRGQGGARRSGSACSSTRRPRRPRAPGTRSRPRSPPAAPRRAGSTARTPPGSPPTPAKSQGRRQGRRGAAADGRGRHGGGRSRRGLYRLLRRRRLRHPALLEEQGGGAALAAVYRPALGPAGLGGRGRAHRADRDLRRPEGQGAGRQGRRLLHADGGEGPAVRRRAAYPFHAQVREAMAPIIYEAIIGNDHAGRGAGQGGRGGRGRAARSSATARTEALDGGSGTAGPPRKPAEPPASARLAHAPARR